MTVSTCQNALLRHTTFDRLITWGLLAAGMMFVRTPVQYYAMRFLLGLAEAGLFPGVIYYLTRWFPPDARGKAISCFYISGPLSNAAMGMVAGTHWVLLFSCAAERALPE